MATTNVLFVCCDNAAISIMAEAILRASAGGRFAAYSAGFRPATAVQPAALEFLAARRVPVDGLAPKSHARFVEPHGPRLDFAIMLCDPVPDPAPEWNGNPVVARWGLDELDGAASGRRLGGEEMRAVFWVLTRRIKILASLPHGRASRRAIQDRVHSIAIWQ